VLAGLPRRLGAVVYEALLVTAILFVTEFALLPVTSHRAADVELPSPAGRTLSFVVLFAVLAAYFATSWSNGRRTLPMKTWHLRLVRRDGATPGGGTALLRYVACWIGPALALGAYLVLHPRGHAAHAAWLLAFNFAWALADPERQFLHDRIAGTLVLDDRQRAAAPS
jgi:uncharacterized RDD family membrane protein YckC